MIVINDCRGGYTHSDASMMAYVGEIMVVVCWDAGRQAPAYAPDE